MSKRSTLQPFSSDMIIDRIRLENPWWVTGRIDPDYDRMKRRQYFNLFLPILKNSEVNRAIVMMGPRRVGKTIMLHHSIQTLLDAGVSPNRIALITIENPIYRNLPLEQFFSLVRELTGQKSAEGWYIIFDEIQYLKEWEIHLKVLVDSYPKTRFIVSGSSAAALKLKSSESGAGRFTDFNLPSLGFSEYIDLLGLGRLVEDFENDEISSPTFLSSPLNIRELNSHFIEYLNYGGYPEVIFSETIRSNPGRYLRSDIIDKVLLRDLPSLYGIRDVQELNSLFTTLAYHSGQEVSLEGLCKASGVDKYLLTKYLEYLEASFLIKKVHRIDQNGKKFRRVNFFKIFLPNPSIRTALFTPIQASDDQFGHVVETTLVSQFLQSPDFKPYYANWGKGEVDLVVLDPRNQKPMWACEIKWSNAVVQTTRLVRNLLQFCGTHSIRKAIVSTIDKSAVVEAQTVQLQFIPAAVLAYVVSKKAVLGQSVRI